MLLTKKSFIKILILTCCFFSVGCFSIAFSLFLSSIGKSDNSLLRLGILVILLTILIFFMSWYLEGKGNLINLGNKLIRKQLKPAEFLRKYENLKNSGNLVVYKPSVEVLQVVMTAYDSLQDKENALKTVDEMISVAKEKKKNYAYLFKSSLLFSYGDFEEAEEIFNKVMQQKLDVICISMADTIQKTDRAIAMGDYKTAEVYNIKFLERAFPKPDNLAKLVVNYSLGEIYEKLHENKKAIAHYQYCIEFGGETAYRKSAMEKFNSFNKCGFLIKRKGAYRFL